MRDDRPAIRAELQADPAPRFVGAMLVRLEVLGALDARVALVEPGRHDKRAPRAALAELAMTGDRADRLAGRRVADGTAEAAAGVDVIIHLASSSGSGSYLLLVLGTDGPSRLTSYRAPLQCNALGQRQSMVLA